MKARIPRAWLACLALAAAIFLPAAAHALSADLAAVEVTVVLRPDGKADVAHRLEWRASGGEMHGFYFQGESFEPVWNAEACWADLPGGRRVPLSIEDLGRGKYDVVLAGGRGFSGRAYYNLAYAGDFAAAGLLARTASAEGARLVVFNWGPVWWDEGLESRAVRLVLPRRVGGERLTEDEKAAIPALTEEFVNAQNKIDWYGSADGSGGYWLTGLFFQEDIPAEGEQRLQLYFPEGYLQLDPGAALAELAAAEEGGEAEVFGEAPPAPGPRESGLDARLRSRPALAAAIFLPLIACALFLYGRRLAAFRRRRALLAGISWAGDAWSPPRILVGSYQVPGKVAEGLHPVEVALLMELPLPRVAAIMLEGLSRQGLVELLAEDPLRIRVLAGRKAESEYEEDFLAAFDHEGRVLSGLMADFFEAAIKKLQEKVWDCDLEATKAHYRAKIQAAESGEEPSASIARRDGLNHYWLGYSYLERHRERYAALSLPKELNVGYAEFMRSAACFSGCFAPAGGKVDACYSACHNACHDACHSA
ncbi:MAG TPA: hypothetical protein P5142_13565, partial [Spirochaetia bacterium]|nr:hypothetical protein [Spirochaetia bacterium]